jgi:single-strand DNA-binding protein
MAVNKFIGIGNLGRDPEIRATAEGTAVANISIAITEKYKDKQGVQKEVTEWVNVAFFGKLAEVVAQYLRKGSKIYVEGKLKTEKYDKNGETRYSTKIIGERMEMIGGREEKKQNEKAESEDDLREANRQTSEQDAFTDDDIPF